VVQASIALIRWTGVIAAVMAAHMANLALAQTTVDPAARCAQLVAFYDRYAEVAA